MGFRYETDPRVVLWTRLQQGYKSLVDKEFIAEMATQTGALTRGIKALPERMTRDSAGREVHDIQFVFYFSDCTFDISG